MAIHSYMDESCILFLNTKTKEETLTKMVDAAEQTGKVGDSSEFQKVIREREDLMSTGIGLGVAVPHAKIKSVSDFFLVIAVLKKPVEWGSIDQEPVRLVFLIGGPDHHQTDYLKILSKIVLVVKNRHRRKELLKAGAPVEIMEHFKNL